MREGKGEEERRGTKEEVVNKFPRGERRTDEVENAPWLWDPSRARLGLETVSRTTEEETDESGAAARAHAHTGPAWSPIPRRIAPKSIPR